MRINIGELGYETDEITLLYDSTTQDRGFMKKALSKAFRVKDSIWAAEFHVSGDDENIKNIILNHFLLVNTGASTEETEKSIIPDTGYYIIYQVSKMPGLYRILWYNTLQQTTFDLVYAEENTPSFNLVTIFDHPIIGKLPDGGRSFSREMEDLIAANLEGD